MHTISIYPGQNKNGEKEAFTALELQSGQMLAVVGNTGAGKSRFIQDIEQLVNKNSISKRTVTLDGKSFAEMPHTAHGLIAHLGQNMRFMLDTNVEEFITLHNACRNKHVATTLVLELANQITPEKISGESLLNMLSGGQSRALMVADIALICDSPIVLIDEIENAGIDKVTALNALLNHEKLLIIVTHDPHTALMAQERIVLQNGGIVKRQKRTEEEEALYHTMTVQYQKNLLMQQQLRTGEPLL